MKYWYYHDSGVQKGPIQEEDFIKLFETGSLTLNTLVWTQGQKEWQAARMVEGLVPPSFSPPPPPLAGTATVTTAPIFETTRGCCPLCKSAKHMPKAKTLYGHMVCKKCYYGFANLRQAAYLIDILTYYVVTFGATFILGIVMAIAGFSQRQIGSAGSILPWALLIVLLFKDCFSGQSLGKAICGVRVIDKTTGEPGDIGASFKRNLPLLVPIIPLVVAGQLSEGPRLGDAWANTKVIWKKYATHPIFAPDNTKP